MPEPALCPARTRPVPGTARRDLQLVYAEPRCSASPGHPTNSRIIKLIWQIFHRRRVTALKCRWNRPRGIESSARDGYGTAFGLLRQRVPHSAQHDVWFDGRVFLVGLIQQGGVEAPAVGEDVQQVASLRAGFLRAVDRSLLLQPDIAVP
jgi:hypothetical protein